MHIGRPARLLLILGLLAVTGPARAVDFNLQLEGSFAQPHGGTRFEGGGAAFARGGVRFWHFVDARLNAGFVGLHAADANRDSTPGIAWLAGGALRFGRPRDTGEGAFPWAEVDLDYARTGTHNSFAFSVGVGLAIPLERSRTWWLSPFARYLRIIGPARAGYAVSDAELVLLGVAIEWDKVRP
jgi:hypothetical protein